MSDDETTGLDRRALKWALKDALDELLGLGEARLAQRFEGGTMVLRPGKSDTQEKTIPIEVFFHKITMVRDRLRVLEQRINSHPRLTDAEKVELLRGGLEQIRTLTFAEFQLFVARGEKWDKTKHAMCPYCGRSSTAKHLVHSWGVIQAIAADLLRLTDQEEPHGNV